MQYCKAPSVWRYVVTLVEDNGSPTVMDILEPTRQRDEYGLAPTILDLDNKFEIYFACLRQGPWED